MKPALLKRGRNRQGSPASTVGLPGRERIARSGFSCSMAQPGRGVPGSSALPARRMDDGPRALSRSRNCRRSAVRHKRRLPPKQMPPLRQGCQHNGSLVIRSMALNCDLLTSSRKTMCSRFLKRIWFGWLGSISP